jgi:hypothetical protein
VEEAGGRCGGLRFWIFVGHGCYQLCHWRAVLHRSGAAGPCKGRYGCRTLP